MHVEGGVLTLTGKCPSLTFIVGTTLVSTSSATTFSGGKCDDVKNGKQVAVDGTRQANGSVKATKVTISKDKNSTDGQ